jgi:hypothetical protein
VLWLKLAIDRMIGSIMRRITTHWHEWPWRDPGAALRNELQRRATIAAADFVTTHMPDALYCGGKFDLLTYAVQQAPPGLALEFGVFKGTTINHLARQAPDRQFFGFDSFEGLPEHWTGARYSAINFDRQGKKPRAFQSICHPTGTLAHRVRRRRVAAPGSGCLREASARSTMAGAEPR